MVTEQVECMTYTIEQAAHALGISRGTAYMLARTGKFPVIRISERRLVVPKVALERMLAEAGKDGEHS